MRLSGANVIVLKNIFLVKNLVKKVSRQRKLKIWRWEKFFNLES